MIAEKCTFDFEIVNIAIFNDDPDMVELLLEISFKVRKH